VFEIFDEDERYVCVSHVSVIPCEKGEHHTVSNWPPDVERVLSAIKNS
jgi:hypothetical protein